MRRDLDPPPTIEQMRSWERGRHRIRPSRRASGLYWLLDWETLAYESPLRGVTRAELWWLLSLPPEHEKVKAIWAAKLPPLVDEEPVEEDGPVHEGELVSFDDVVERQHGEGEVMRLEDFEERRSADG